MPLNPTKEQTRLSQTLTALRNEWYWFRMNHLDGDVFAALFLGILIGLWFS